MNDLEALADPGTTLADVARAVALGDVLEKVVKQRREELRDGPLADLAAQAAEVTGSDGFTSRIGGVGQVIQNAPTPTVKVADPQTFGRWLADNGGEDMGLVVLHREVEVVDHARAVKLLDQWEQGDVRIWTAGQVMELLDVVHEWLPSETAVDTLLDRRWIVVHDGRVHKLDPDQGEIGAPVPGLTVTQARQSTYVKVDKQARAKVTGQVRQALGLERGDT